MLEEANRQMGGNPAAKRSRNVFGLGWCHAVRAAVASDSLRSDRVFELITWLGAARHCGVARSGGCELALFFYRSGIDV